MDTRFDTANGTVTLEGGILRFLEKKFRWDWWTAVRCLLPVLFAFRFFEKLQSPPSASQKVGLVIYGVAALLLFSVFLLDFFTEHRLQTLNLKDVNDFTVQDRRGKNVVVTLMLSSGKERTIHFRKQENEWKRFTETVSEYITTANGVAHA